MKENIDRKMIETKIAELITEYEKEYRDYRIDGIEIIRYDYKNSPLDFLQTDKIDVSLNKKVK